MEKLAQELVDEIIDNVHHADLPACSLVASHWVDPSHRRVWGSGYCSFMSKQQLRPWLASLRLLKHSSVVNRVHTLTLAYTSVQGWALYFDSTDVVFPNLKSLTVVDPQARLDDYLPVLKRHFGNTLESLTLSRVFIDADELYSIIGSFPSLNDLTIASVPDPHGVLPLHENPPTGLRTQGKLSLVDDETQAVCIPLLLRLPAVQFRTLYFSDTFQLDVEKINQLVSACSSTLVTLEIRGDVFPPRLYSSRFLPTEQDGVPRIWHAPPALALQHYPELQTIRFTLPNYETPRDSVVSILSSIASAPKLSEITFNFIQMQLEGDLDKSGLAEWGLVDAQLCRLARQAATEMTVVFDFPTKPGWVPKRDASGMKSMSKFRPCGVMILRSCGEEKAVYRS